MVETTITIDAKDAVNYTVNVIQGAATMTYHVNGVPHEMTGWGEITLRRPELTPTYPDPEFDFDPAL